MIELTEQQRQALRTNPEEPIRITDSETQQQFVLVRADIYDQIQARCDDSPWTDEEMDMLAAEAGEMLDAFRKKP